MISGTTFHFLDHFHDFLSAGAPKRPKKQWAGEGFETWCEEVRKTCDKWKTSDFRQDAFQNPPQVVLKCLPDPPLDFYWKHENYGISRFCYFSQSWHRHAHFIYKTNRKIMILRGAEYEKVKVHENSLFALRADPL